MRCPSCNGNGWKKGERCPNCRGTGHIGKDDDDDDGHYPEDTGAKE